jgi:hypothetical protein
MTALRAIGMTARERQEMATEVENLGVENIAKIVGR